MTQGAPGTPIDPVQPVHLSLRMDNPAAVDVLYASLPPGELRIAFMAAHLRLLELPRSPDRTAALRALREAALWAGEAAR